MADADFSMGAGDSLPLIDTILLGEDGQPMDLTGKTATFEIAPADGSAAAVVRAVTIDPDQVTVGHRGHVTCKAFDPNVSTAQLYEGRFYVVVTATLDRLSVLNNRLITINVTRRPGPSS